MDDIDRKYLESDSYEPDHVFEEMKKTISESCVPQPILVKQLCLFGV